MFPPEIHLQPLIRAHLSQALDAESRKRISYVLNQTGAYIDLHFWISIVTIARGLIRVLLDNFSHGGKTRLKYQDAMSNKDDRSEFLL